MSRELSGLKGLNYYTYFDILSIRFFVSSISLPVHCCNNVDLTYLDFSRFPFLESLTIGSYSFRYVSTFTLDNMKRLKRLIIQSASLTLSNGSEIQSTFEFQYPKDIERKFVYPNFGYSFFLGYTVLGDLECGHGSKCQITNCESLEVIEIGNCSFAKYAAFDLHNLPSLKQLIIGRNIHCSANFCSSSLFIKGNVCHHLVNRLSKTWDNKDRRIFVFQSKRNKDRKLFLHKQYYL